jgi:CheY-like chemotaxis protein
MASTSIMKDESMELVRQAGKSLVLIVDDTSYGRDTLEAVLYSPDYQLLFAADGNEAIRKAEALPPDLILLDVMMPGMNGFEVSRHLRRQPHTAEVPIVMVTALDDRSSRLRGIEAGADDFITKPFDTAELRARVRTITRLNRFRRLLEERSRLDWMIEHSEDGYLLLDGDVICTANLAVPQLLGVAAEPATLTGRSFRQVVNAEHRCEPAANWRNWPHLSDEATPRPLLLIRPESNTFHPSWLEVTIVRRPGVTPERQLVRLRNVTSSLANRRDMWAFHTMVMHKLNTPVHMMVGAMDLLASDAMVDMERSQIAEMAASYLAGAKRLEGAITEVLRFLRVNAQPSDEVLTLAQLPVLVAEVIAQQHDAEIVPEMMHSLTSSIATGELVQPDLLRLNRNGMEMILIELIGNAVKFHPRKRPKMTIRAQRLADAIRIEVIDDGVCLSPDQLAQVWTPYYQAEKYFTGEVPGMGLGLPMVASLVWGAGGSCRMSNRPDQPGAIVTIEIPIEGANPVA